MNKYKSIFLAALLSGTTLATLQLSQKPAEANVVVQIIRRGQDIYKCVQTKCWKS